MASFTLLLETEENEPALPPSTMCTEDSFELTMMEAFLTTIHTLHNLDSPTPIDAPTLKGECPRVHLATVCSEIYAHGLRNPFRISMDPNTKDKVKMAIGDVGVQHIESLYYWGTDYKGAVYPWPTFEGLVSLEICKVVLVCPTQTLLHQFIGK
jgi:hypothetical protein